MTTHVEKILEIIKSQKPEFIDFRFTDMRGQWHHMSFPRSQISQKQLNEGIYFDGSSIAGWRDVNESDMVLKPTNQTLCMDPFAAHSTLVVFCDVYTPEGEPYERDPRTIARKGEAYLKTLSFADQAFFGPEAEFFVFDGVRAEASGPASFYYLHSDEFQSTTTDELSHGHRPGPKGGYFPVVPLDGLHDIRAEMCQYMSEMGLSVEKHHHEVAPAQHELGIKYGELVDAADQIQIYKYVVRNTAHAYGKSATFMPKPYWGDNGSGMHVHQSLWNKGKPTFAGKGYGGLSEQALYYIGGILKHAKALNAFTNPTTNSYKRLIPGFEAPVVLAYSKKNRSAACRLPCGEGDKAKRVEVRFPDPLANSYLAFTAMMMAGIDGIQNKIHPGDACEGNLFEDKELAAKFPTVCGSLREALEVLEKDHQFLLAGNVFTKDFIEAYIALKWPEVYTFEHHPHPVEFKMYYSL